MNEELKTLKDFEVSIPQAAILSIVKKEAIKIKKSINDWSNKGVLHKEFKKLSGFEKLNVDTFMKWFFNLIKEDLK